MKVLLNRAPIALIGLALMALVISGCSMTGGLLDGNGPLATTPEKLAIASSQVNSDLTDFDLSNNGVIDDDEFFRVIDMWIEGDIGNLTFFEVIDAWAGQATLDDVYVKSKAPDKSKIKFYRGTVPQGGLYVVGLPGAVEPEASVIVRDEIGNAALAIAEFDGSFRLTEFDLPVGFDHSLGGRIEVTQKYDKRHWSNPVVLVIQYM